MCGIAGVVSATHPDVGQVKVLRDRLIHRGPDSSGTWKSPDKRVVLAHRRLSILDISPSSHQPMISTSGRYTMVYNGEIYNYLELRKELQKLGHVFQSSGDSEVVLVAYEKWGEACLLRLNGMFSIAIHDRGNEHEPPSLFFARDRAGKKPLYIARNDTELAFASELKAIPDSLRGGLNYDALNFYLALGYIPDKLCIAEGVMKLPPAHAARYMINSGEFRLWRWWSLPALNPDSGVSAEQLLDEVEALMHDAVRLRMRSDVPVGILLSGGLDSSLVVACAAKTSSHVKTFTMSLPGSHLDETSYAAIVARHFGTDHHVLTLREPTLSVLDELAPLIDEPLADSSLIPSYLVSKLTAGYVKVALGGDGGDELFGGYGDYTTALSDARRLISVPPFFLRGLALAAGQLPTGVRGRNRLYALRNGPYESMIWGSPYFDAPARKRILSSDVVAMLGERFMAPEHFLLSLFEQGQDPVDRMTRTHFGSILPDDFLVKVDRASMAVGLEMRCPLLDHRLIEFAFARLPSLWKVKGSESRRLQKQLGRRLLPLQLDIERKQGFSIPLDEWLRNSRGMELRETKGKLPGAINQREVDALLKGQEKGRANGSRIFALLMLGLALGNLSKS